MFESIDSTADTLRAHGYFAERPLAAAIFLALRLERPLLLEGEAGVGKTEVAKALAAALGGRLIRLQAYEGIDIAAAVYEWNYPKQLLAMQSGVAKQDGLADIYSADFLIRRPILDAIDNTDDSPSVLLIDEIDRADDEFEAFLLEVLSDFQVTIPELGTVVAKRRPVVILTSNRTRELHDALKRRCFYHWIEYPTFEKECAIVSARIPDITDSLRRQLVAFVQEVRRMDLYKAPGMAETLDWARALQALNQTELKQDAVDVTLGLLVKNQEDVAQISGDRAASALEAAQRAS